MTFNKVSFEGVVNYSFSDVVIDTAMRFEGNILYFQGRQIPIRKTLWTSFRQEFGYHYSCHKTYHTIKFLITPDGGYMYKNYMGNKVDNFVGRIMSIGLEDNWKSPRYGDMEFKMPSNDEDEW